MSERVLNQIRDLIQEDVNQRGLRTDPERNLITECADDFAAVCRSLVETPGAMVGIVTGFFIPTADPPAGESDGPLGALFLARALTPLGISMVLLTDGFCEPALSAGLAACGLDKTVQLLELPHAEQPLEEALHLVTSVVTHLIALERVGPSHTPESVRAQPGATLEAVAQFQREVHSDHFDRCHTMRGRDITAHMSPAHRLFEAAHQYNPSLTTIGIGDGGNEIGMGKIPWEVIRRNVPSGGLVACRVPTDHLVVCGVSNWGAYGLAAGVRLLRDAWDGELFDAHRERELLQIMVEKGPLVDGVTGQPTATVDGLDFERYVEPLRRIANLGIASQQ
jgi:hypothetical protein